MKCTDHKKVDAIASCVACGNFFCADCLINVKKKKYCKDCSAELLADADGQSRRVGPIIFQQQQQQNGNVQPVVEKREDIPFNWKEFKSIAKWCIAAFMIISSSGLFGNGYYLSGLIAIMLGLYWMPPVQSFVHKKIKERFDFEVPGWLRNLVSVVLFFIIFSIKI